MTDQHTPEPLTILLAQPRGFCAGVERAIDIVVRAIELYGAPVYVRHEIVHNKYVVDELREKGAIFIDDIEDIPDGAITVFSAHGVSEKVENEARLRDLPVVDATCPLVTKVHNQARHYEKDDHEIILIGHEGHPEVEGTSGRVKQTVHIVPDVASVNILEVNNPDKLAYVTQTTLSVDDTRDIIAALRARFPFITGPDVKDICYATQNRQSAVKELAPHIDLLLVIGAQNSSNSNRLRDIGQEMNVPAYLIDTAKEIDESWFEGITTMGLTAGASAPEILLQEVIDRIMDLPRPVKVTPFDGIVETMRFNLPREVRTPMLKDKVKQVA